MNALLAPLLDKHGLTEALFVKKGRLPEDLKWVAEARSAVVTELHSMGLAWKDLESITGLSNGSIQRLTKAKGNPVSKAKIKAQAAALGKTWEGKTRHDQLKKQWEKGNFDHLRGSKMSESSKANLRAGWTPPVRKQRSKLSLDLWRGQTGERLRAFHADPAERTRRSTAQTARMAQAPAKYLKGKSSVVKTPKGTQPKVTVRSSYEAAAIRVLEADPAVLGYEYEAVLQLANGKHILPDFLVHYATGTTLVEVKAAWATRLPATHKVTERLKVAKDYACQQGWGFTVWTEKELAHAF